MSERTGVHAAGRVDDDPEAGWRRLVGGRSLRIVLVVLLTMTTVMFGSADRIPMHLFAGLTLVFAIAVVALRGIPRDLGQLAVRASWVAIIVAGVALFQAVPYAPDTLANPIWSVVQETLGMRFGAISVDPYKTVASVPPVLLPFAVFVATLSLCDTDRGAMHLLRLLAAVGGVLAVFSVIQFQLFPGTLVAIPKEAYLDSLTGTFVNRNTAATYFAAIAILAAGFLVSAFLSGDGRVSGRLAILDPRIVFGAILTAALIALALTKSRAGVASAVAGFAVVVPLVAMLPPGGRRSARGFTMRPATPLRRRIGIGAAALVAVGLAALLIGGRSLLRLDVQGLEDGRFCILPGVFELILDNWLTGTGLGTFEVAFDAYRDPACGIYGVWDSAHNVYLDGLVTLGVVTIPVTLFILITLASAFLRGLKRRQRLRAFPAVGLGLTVLVVAHSLLDFSLEIPGFAAPFAAMLAATAAVSARSLRPYSTEE